MLVSIKNCNFTRISHVISFKYHLRVVKTRKLEDKQLCSLVHMINNIRDADPLDNSSNKA